MLWALSGSGVPSSMRLPFSSTGSVDAFAQTCVDTSQEGRWARILAISHI